MEHKSGFVGVVGEPNVGKSTLINRLVKQKIAIVSAKPQTTRNRLLAILTEPDYQIIFIDTPGILKQRRNQLDNFMEEECQAAYSAEVEILLILVAADEPVAVSYLEEILKKSPKNCKNFLVLNKIDLIDQNKTLTLLEKYKDIPRISRVLTISALNGNNTDELLKEIIDNTPLNPPYFPEDIICNASERFIIQEIVREKLFSELNQEVPYCVAVVTEEVKLRPNGMYFVKAVIYVEHDSQKAIIIGKNGAMLKKIGQISRPDIESMLDASVYLDLWVKVEKNWRKNLQGLNKLGYKHC